MPGVHTPHQRKSKSKSSGFHLGKFKFTAAVRIEPRRHRYQTEVKFTHKLMWVSKLRMHVAIHNVWLARGRAGTVRQYRKVGVGARYLPASCPPLVLSCLTLIDIDESCASAQLHVERRRSARNSTSKPELQAHNLTQYSTHLEPGSSGPASACRAARKSGGIIRKIAGFFQNRGSAPQKRGCAGQNGLLDQKSSPQHNALCGKVAARQHAGDVFW